VTRPASIGPPAIDTPSIDDAKFKADLVAMIPHLRAFARSLSGSPDSDDLAQETMMRGWQWRARFIPGSNLKAWLFTILRNQFLSEKRRSWRRQPLDPEVAEKTLVAIDNPDSAESLIDLRSAMQMLPVEQREALVLVAAAGLSYDETAGICGCAVGTIKSRVARGRVALEALLSGGKLPSRRQHKTNPDKSALQEIMSEVDELSRDRD
jgi:RNA polymerase sigma factor (sigma-70 family)